MDELVNIANYCSSVLVRYGQIVKHCNAVYIQGEDVIQVNVRYRVPGDDVLHVFQYQIQSNDFLITDTEVQVNKSAINNINAEIEKYVNNKVLN